MKNRRFLIPSLLAAGFSIDKAAALPVDPPSKEPSSDKSLFDIFQLAHEYDLAAHRSHSSHRSHGSHRSGAGGSAAPRYTPPTRNLQSTPPSSVLPGSPSTAPKKTLPGNSPKFAEITRRVQAALYASGYYTGPLDGVVGSETRLAISRYQKDHGIKVDGNISTELLNALRVKAD